ncbi:MAG: mandelate racemase/muconate lactonizing enzyme family protein [Betaproteobacteria bacterium]|nr:mandelate racemase/muconate lactonizing enzyme family protein [Betaproteobacteria bacterium]
MKITKVETIVVNMPMIIEGAVMPKQGGRPRTSMDTLLVRVDTDDGVTGWGEGFGHRIFNATKAALDSFIGPMCVGRDPTAISALVDELQRNLAGVGRNGPAMYALSAIDMARQLVPFNLKWLEEPVWPPEDYAGLARVQAQGGIPTAAGENAMLPEFKGLLEAGAVTYAQPSVTKMGGVTQMRKVVALADAHGVAVVPHSAYFGPGLLASIHCIAAMPRGGLVERYDADFAVNPLHDAIHPDGKGCIAVPQGPGLGIDPDLKVVEGLRVF